MTNRLKPAMERVARRPREHAGRSVSERRAGLENCNAGADPPFNRGRLPSIGGPAKGRKRAITFCRRSRRGIDGDMHANGDQT